MIKSHFNNLNGWIIIDKQAGITSRQIVSKISKIFRLNKIGHGGTLDPMATGVLPIALGEATKLISFIQNKKKIVIDPKLLKGLIDQNSNKIKPDKIIDLFLD